MDQLIHNLNIYMIPPLMSLVVGITLAFISIAKGKIKSENILFALVCVMWTLLAPAFLSHHLLESKESILKVERSIHTIYVFLPFINLAFYHKILELKKRKVEYITFAFSIIFALTTHSEYYIEGLNSFTWGYIAKAGIAFNFFAVYAFAVLVYGIVLCIQRIRVETNQVTKMKIKYILYALNLTGILTVFNLPAILGYNFYPLGNFIFLSLSIMGYGILRYRLLDIRSILHITFIWAIISSLIIIPNIFIFRLLYPHFSKIDSETFFGILVVWFFLNYLYFSNIQPFINQFFNRRKFNLIKTESHFIEDISILKDLNLFIHELSDTLKRTLLVRSVDVFLQREEDDSLYYNMAGSSIMLDESLNTLLCTRNDIIEKQMVETSPEYEYHRKLILDFLQRNDADFIVPLIQNGELIGIILMSERSNLKPLSSDEVRFLNSIRNAASISLANSRMYQNITNLKNNLEKLVEERTHELQQKNEQMIFELQVAKNVQQKILPSELPANSHIQSRVHFAPLMEVSGDFYNFVFLDNEHLALYIVDVSGHGVPSALLTSMISAEVESQLKKEQSTAAICSNINQILTPLLVETGFYFTIFLGILDLVNLQMEYTNCGHTEIYVLTNNGTIFPLTSDGFFIGANPDFTYTSSNIELHSNDRLVLYTDGITEARDESGNFYGEERFQNILMASRELSIGEQLDIIVRDIDGFIRDATSRRQDDITLVILEIGKPVSPSHYLKKAVKYYREKEYDRALEILQSLNARSMSGAHLFLLSKLQSKKGEYESALSSIDIALEKNPLKTEFLYQKGKILYRLDRLSEAREVFTQVENEDPGYKKVSLLIRQIESKGY
ncbi:MAG: SpoIIE family protein phosphatase [Spirochaetota bacterium]